MQLWHSRILLQGLSVPNTPEVRAISSSITVSWLKPLFFGDLCKYTIEAVATVGNRTEMVSLVPPPLGRYFYTVKFDSLKPATNYTFYIETKCGNSTFQRIKVGEKESNPGTPGVPQEPLLTLVDPRTINFTWKPPTVLFGRENFYEWFCRYLQSKFFKEGKTTNSYALVANFAPGNVSCVVKAVSKTPGHEEMKGGLTKPVHLVVPRHGEGIIFSWLFHWICYTRWRER